MRKSDGAGAKLQEGEGGNNLSYQGEFAEKTGGAVTYLNENSVAIFIQNACTAGKIQASWGRQLRSSREPGAIVKDVT
jgi:hypothetical protein